MISVVTLGSGPRVTVGGVGDGWWVGER